MMADRTRIVQVLTNLLSNAARLRPNRRPSGSKRRGMACMWRYR